MFSNYKVKFKKIFYILSFVFACVALTACGRDDKNFKKAEGLVKSGKYSESLQYYEKAIKAEKDRADYYIAYGAALNKVGNYNKAIDYFEKAISDANNKITRSYTKEANYGMAVSHMALHSYDMASDNLNEAIKIAEIPEMNYDIYVAMCKNNVKLGNNDEAIEAATKAIESDKKRSDGYYCRAYVNYLKQDYQGSINDLNVCLENDSRNYDAYFLLYNVYSDMGDVDSGEKALDSLYNMKGNDSELVCQKGRVAYTLGDFEEAEKLYKVAIEDNYDAAWFYVGNLYVEMLSYDEAAEAYKEALKKDTEIPKAKIYHNLANCALILRDYENALEYIEMGLSDNTVGSFENLLINKILVLEKLGRYEEALAAANDYQAEYPNNESMSKEIEFINTRIASREFNENIASHAKNSEDEEKIYETEDGIFEEEVNTPSGEIETAEDAQVTETPAEESTTENTATENTATENTTTENTTTENTTTQEQTTTDNTGTVEDFTVTEDTTETVTE